MMGHNKFFLVNWELIDSNESDGQKWYKNNITLKKNFKINSLRTIKLLLMMEEI